MASNTDTTYRKTSLTAGILYLLTFVSIPTLTLYGAVKGTDYVTGSGTDTAAITGGILEIIVALACIGTAVVLYPLLKKQSERMAVLIGDLLRVSSLDLGTYRLEEKEVDVNKLLETVIYDQRKAITHKSISLAVNVGPNVPVIKTDEQLLGIVFQNLLSNSVKYSRNNGKVEVSVIARKRSLLIRVSDNGIGIPAKQQSQIFTKLFRADNAVRYNFSKGTGLGLYIVKAMVGRLGGKIWFDSVENEGSNFYVKIPL